MGMSLEECAHDLENYRMPTKRLAIFKGINDTLIMDDTYNASPLSMYAALNALKQYPCKRKIAILGEMKELGRYSHEAHKKVAEQALLCADIVMTVGEAWGSGRTAGSELAVRPLILDAIQSGDVILVKGSRAMHMDKIVDALVE